jgi:glycosyltransferase involved in cell wall biosynthesis
MSGEVIKGLTFNPPPMVRIVDADFRDEIDFSILITHVPGPRTESLNALLERLVGQTIGRPVEIFIYAEPEYSVGMKRQILMDNAIGKYIAYIDDDDMVPEYYVDEILKAIQKGVDYIGFQMQMSVDGVDTKPTFHDWERYKYWYDDENGYYRGVSDKNPVRRSIAVNHPFVDVSLGEDRHWADRVAQDIKTSTYIDKIMYYYIWSPSGTLTQR